MLKRSFVLLCVTTLLTIKANAQQPTRYTQYMNNLTLLNPAYSLVDNTGSISTLVRKQLIGINGAPATYAINGNLPIESINGAAGLIIQNDEIAVEHQFQANAYFAKAIRLTEAEFLGVSLNGGFKNYRANYSGLDATDPQFREDVRETRPNIGFGVIYFTKDYYIGLSAPELTLRSLGTASVQTGSNFRNHYYLSGAYLATVGDDVQFKPAAFVGVTRGQDALVNVSGTLYLKEMLGIGANYSSNKQVAGILSINTSTIKIGYSYQFNASSGLSNSYSAAHEVTLSYRFGKQATNNRLL